MPTYKITDPDTGKVFKLTGDSPPTESELNDIFKSPEIPKKNTESGNFLTTENLSNAPIYDPLAQAARLGQFANRGNQELAGIIAERSGAASSREPTVSIPLPGGTSIDAGAIPGIIGAGTLATASEFLLPQNRLGVAAYAAQPVSKAIGRGYQYLRNNTDIVPNIEKGASDIVRLATNAPEKSAEALIRNPGVVLNAPTDAQVAEKYDKFSKMSGTVSRKADVMASGQFDRASRASQDVENALQKLRSGELTLQEAVNASQAARIINDMKSRGVELAQEVADQAQAYKPLFDDFIEKGSKARMAIDPLTGGVKEVAGTPGFPQWADARQASFRNKVSSDFSNIIPQNINGSPQFMRTFGAVGIGSGIGGAIAGPIGSAAGGLIGAAVVSPATYGSIARNAASIPGVVGPGAIAASNAVRYVVRPSNSSLEQEYMRNR